MHFNRACSIHTENVRVSGDVFTLEGFYKCFPAPPSFLSPVQFCLLIENNNGIVFMASAKERIYVH